MSERFAVYVLVVEDTEDNSLAMGDLGASNIESVNDIESEQEAIDRAQAAIEAAR